MAKQRTPTPRPTQTTGDAERRKAVELAVGNIEKQFGKGAILSMTDDAVDREIGHFSAGSPSLDIALGIGGYPRGRVVEIYGPESSGKTTLTLHAIAEVQKPGRRRRLHRRRARPRRELRPQARGEDRGAAGVAARLRRASARDLRDAGASGAVDVVVVDSVAALVPRRPRSRARWATCHAGPAGAADESGAAQAHRAPSRSRTAW